MRDGPRVRPEQPEPIDTPFLSFVVVVFVCLVALGYVLFPRHDSAAAIGPGATATPNTGGGGPGAPPTTTPASPGGNTAR